MFRVQQFLSRRPFSVFCFFCSPEFITTLININALITIILLFQKKKPRTLKCIESVLSCHAIHSIGRFLYREKINVSHFDRFMLPTLFPPLRVSVVIACRYYHRIISTYRQSEATTKNIINTFWLSFVRLSFYIARILSLALILKEKRVTPRALMSFGLSVKVKIHSRLVPATSLKFFIILLNGMNCGWKSIAYSMTTTLWI